MTKGWREVRCDVRGVRQRGADLFEAQRVLRGYGVGRFTSREGADDRGDVDARAAEARLPESNAGSMETPGKEIPSASP